MSLTFKNRVGTSENLPEGGTYDLLMVDFPNGFPNSKLTFDLGITPRKVNGLQKVAQTFLKILFTSKGTDLIHGNTGTNFQKFVINSNVIMSDNLFRAELAEEIRAAEYQTKNILNSYGSDKASQLDRVTILRLDTSQERLVLFMHILTKAGSGANMAIPFPQLDLALN